MTWTWLTLVMLSMTMACTTVRVLPQPPAAEISGRWLGTWRAIDTTNVAREGRLDVDFAQDGARGRGRMVWWDTLITDVPQSARLAGMMGVPIVFTVTGSSVVVRHEQGASELAMQMTVRGDEIAGAVDSAARVEIRLTRQWSPSGATMLERLGRLENDSVRAREQMSGLDARVVSLGTSVENTRGAVDDAANTARQALAAAGESRDRTTRVDDLEQKILAAANGHSDGHAERAIVHTLDVRFAVDKSDLDDSGTTALTEVVDLLKENPELSTELEGYTDSTGSVEHNLRLSQRRVESVHRYLARRGVSLDRIHIVGLGRLTDKDVETRSVNRRVTVKLLIAEN